MSRAADAQAPEPQKTVLQRANGEFTPKLQMIFPA